MPILYHYTKMAYLPSILADGLNRGELADGTPRPALTGVVNLTSQTDPDRLYCWGKNLHDRTALRLTCRISDADPKLEGTKDAWKRLGVSKPNRDRCDRHGAAKWWFIYHGVIPPDWFRVHLRGRAGYVELTEADRGRVCEVIEAEAQNYVRKLEDGLMYVGLAKGVPEDHDRWYLEEVYPADRFGISREPATG